jgi:hypothetical protein
MSLYIPFRLRAVLLLLCFVPLSNSQARTYRAPATLGAGAQLHQFVLKDPVTHQPMPHARYRLFLPGHQIVGVPVATDGKDSVVFGVTDGAGHTVRIRLSQRHALNEWVLNPIIGEGDNGESFRLTASGDGEALAGFPYMLDVDGGYLFCSRTDASGFTFYAQTRQSRQLSLLHSVELGEADFAWCAGPGAAIANQQGEAGAADLYTQYLGTLRANGDGLSEDLQERLVRKLLALAIAERNVSRIELALSQRPVRDSELNDYGYDLADADLLVDRGLAMIEERLAQKPDDAFAMDSKGWALYRLGRHEEALSWMNRSLERFVQADGDQAGTKSSDRRHTAQAISLVHKGEVLWQLWRRDDARAAFLQSRRIDPDGKMLKATVERLAVDLL